MTQSTPGEVAFLETMPVTAAATELPCAPCNACPTPVLCHLLVVIVGCAVWLLLITTFNWP